MPPTEGLVGRDTGHRITLVPCLAFSVGTMVGGGVFTLSGVAVAKAGPAAIISYLIAAVVMALSALSFVAVAARAERGDSGYGPLLGLLGQPWRFLVMWAFYVNGVLGIAFLVVSFGEYMHSDLIGAISASGAALLATAVLVGLNFGPADLVGRAETFIVVVKIGILALLVTYGVGSIGDARFTPFTPHHASGVLETAALLFTVYTGFNVVTNMAGRIHAPERTIPLAVMLSLAIAAIIYVGVVVALLASGITSFGVTSLADAADRLMGGWGRWLIAFAACLSTLSGANAQVLGASELTLRLAAQRDVPPAVARATQSGYPYVSVLVIGAAAALLVLFSDVDTVIALANVAALAAMIVMNAAAFRLARQGWPGGIRLPGGILIPVLATLACLAQVPSLGARNVVVGLALLALGMVLYVFRRKQRFGQGVTEAAQLAIAAATTPLARALATLDAFPPRRARRPPAAGRDKRYQ